MFLRIYGKKFTWFYVIFLERRRKPLQKRGNKTERLIFKNVNSSSESTVARYLLAACTTININYIKES